MLKAIVNYSKKVPAETEYSSQGYSLSLETEIAAGDSASVQTQIHDAFQLVKASVEQELAGNGNGSAVPVQAKDEAPARDPGERPAPQRQEPRKASNKQIGYINVLAGNRGIPLSEVTAEIRRRFNAESLYDLTAREASQLIDEMSRAGRSRAA
jgi:hypothetical protein